MSSMCSIDENDRPSFKKIFENVPLYENVKSFLESSK